MPSNRRGVAGLDVGRGADVLARADLQRVEVDVAVGAGLEREPDLVDARLQREVARGERPPFQSGPVVGRLQLRCLTPLTYSATVFVPG